MTKLDDHPSVVRFRRSEPRPHPGTLDADRLRQLCLDAGADDVGFVAIDRPELDDQRSEILGLYPWTKGLISLVLRMNRQPIRLLNTHNPPIRRELHPGPGLDRGRIPDIHSWVWEDSI